MDSLLTAIDQQTQQTKPSTHQTMSIESLLDSNGETSNKRHYNNLVEDNGHIKSAKRKLINNNNNNYASITTTATTKAQLQQPSININNNNKSSRSQTLPHLTSQMTTITCYHAAVAQKSYGSEKRFLCPPPIVQVQSPNSNISSSCRLAMAVVSENGENPLEQQGTLEDHQCTFKYLHVTGTAKAKQFSLRVNISSATTSDNNNNNIEEMDHLKTASPLYATFLSNPISIISKPSKKTSKARNVSTCVLANQPVSLFNRINSQTVRTKYMTSDNKKLCAKNSSWSPFEIIVLHQPTQYQHLTQQRPSSTTTSSTSSPSSSNNNNNIQPLIYGSEIILKDTKTNICSQPVIIRKVDKGRIIPGAYGPVSQMQKIALQLSSTSTSSPLLYLSAISASETNDTGVVPAHSPHASILDFAPSRIIPDGLESYEKVEDYLCWTIVGISTFEYSFYDNQAQPSMMNRSSSSSSSSSASLTSSSSSPSPSPSLSSTTTSSNLCSLSSSPIPSPSLNHHHHLQQQHHSYNNNNNKSLASSLLPSSSSSLTIDSTNNNNHSKRCITPFPIITSIQYKPLTHSLDIIGQHLMQAVPSPKLLQLWLGSHHEPLPITLQPQPPQPHQTHLLVDLPSTQDLIVANHDRLRPSTENNTGKRTLELPLYFVREDGVVYHSGKALICELLMTTDAGRWSIVDVRQ
ncbi:unnamed protein product [Cunninghamella echinulata]